MSCCEGPQRDRFMGSKGFSPQPPTPQSAQQGAEGQRSAFSERLQRMDDFAAAGKGLLLEMRATLQSFHDRHAEALTRQDTLLSHHEALMKAFESSRPLEREFRRSQDRDSLSTVPGRESKLSQIPGAPQCLPGLPDNGGKAEADPWRQSVLPAEQKDGVPGARQLRKTVMPDSGKVALQRSKERLVLDFDQDKSSATDMGKEVYDVTSFYKDTGWAQRLARSEWFQNITFLVIFTNAAYIGLDAAYNDADSPLDAHWGFQLSEQLFCTFFISELLVRFCAFEQKRDSLRDLWFKFDAVLVMLMISETWVMLLVLGILGQVVSFNTGPTRLLRLMRLARLTRLLRALPELVSMMKGMRVASRAVGSSLLMLLLQTYVFAIPLHTFLREEEDLMLEERFGTLLRCMFTLIMDGTFMDNTGNLMWTLLDKNYVHAVTLFMMFVLLSSMTMMNMVIGILCEVVSAVAKAEKEEAQVRFIKETILVMLKSLDEDGSGTISKEELMAVCQDSDAMKVLRDLGVDVNYLLETLSMLYSQPTASVPIRDIMDGIMSLRGDRSATVKDVIDANAFVRFTVGSQIVALQSRLESLLVGPSPSWPTASGRASGNDRG